MQLLPDTSGIFSMALLFGAHCRCATADGYPSSTGRFKLHVVCEVFHNEEHSGGGVLVLEKEIEKVDANHRQP